MKARLLLLSLACLLASCTCTRIQALDVTLGTCSAKNSRGAKVDLAPVMPYLKRATWSNCRQLFTVWKVWDDFRLENGTLLQVHSGGYFRIEGVAGEYYVRQEDVGKFGPALEKVKR